MVLNNSHQILNLNV